ncbi:MAG: hypothetical protein PF541_19125 [Prolixibacteraceae bacterium]|jgi:hypothetical protein|nr:hypothetical protein [Prolixibacteraceae bacterium]
MRITYLLSLLLFLVLYACQNENIENLYENVENLKPISTNGLLAHITFDNSISDISPNQLAVALQGEAEFIDGVKGDGDRAIHLDGYPQSLSVTGVGIHDSMSIFMWFKSDEALSATSSATLFDYGLNSFSAQIDGTTGATRFVTKHNYESTTIEPYINSFYSWNYMYIETGSGKLNVKYKGSLQNGEELEINEEISSEGIIKSLVDIVYFGRSSSGDNVNESFFKGGIDNIRIYNRPLSIDEITSLINE